MHTIKDATVHIFDIITGRDDTESCRRCDINLGRSFGMTSIVQQTKITRKDPGVTYSLSTNELKLVNKRTETIITPAHIDFVPKQFFSKPAGLKSHDWKQVC